MHSNTIGKLTLTTVSVGSLSIFSYLLFRDKNEEKDYTSLLKRKYGINDDVKNLYIKGNPIKPYKRSCNKLWQ